MEKFPKVSIMIPTYGQEEYISEAIESAVKQDYRNLEIIVADDCSPDNTGQIAQSIDDERVIYHKNSINLGRVGNYHNTAHNVASGQWAVNLDGDDFYTSSTFITDAMNAICALPNDNIVAYCYRHPNLETIKKTIPFKPIDNDRIIVNGKDYFLNYYRIGSFGHPNTIFRRDLGTQISLYTLPYQACDFHSLIRIFLLGNIILDRRQIAHWRVHGKNTTIKEVDDRQRQAMLTFDAIEEFAKDYCSEKELGIWRRNMNRLSFDDYIHTHVYAKKNWKSLFLLLTHPRPHRWYIKCWMHILFNR